ncbi:sensor histidine kinase [Methylomonas sp. HYX-M1]|uniref:sensor histidine kinase n=1 Tax=Methylomonas sp. HYX-M1 TaxID=3139307 RepID=UPI00345BAB4C
MNLQLHLCSRIAAVSLLCLSGIAAYTLYDSHRQQRAELERIADTLTAQLALQLNRERSGLGNNRPFPDFEVWKQSSPAAGICIKLSDYRSESVKYLCNGAVAHAAEVPAAFTRAYQWLFHPDAPLGKKLAVNRRAVAELQVWADSTTLIERAWQQIAGLLQLSASSIIAAGIMIFISINRIFAPARTIAANLERWQYQELAAQRLPAFKQTEWQIIAGAFNRFAESQQQLQQQRQRLIGQLMAVQEQERTSLAHELHDEFGQCLTAINAVAASLKRLPADKHAQVGIQAEQINRYSNRLMASLRETLRRLRPLELEHLGLAGNLRSIIDEWKPICATQTEYTLKIHGDCMPIANEIAVTLLRTAQECLTNIVKHAEAKHVEVELDVGIGQVKLRIQDDGVAAKLPLPISDGIGLIGIKERVRTLQGQMALSLAQPHGLIVEIRLPVSSSGASG